MVLFFTNIRIWTDICCVNLTAPACLCELACPNLLTPTGLLQYLLMIACGVTFLPTNDGPVLHKRPNLDRLVFRELDCPSLLVWTCLPQLAYINCFALIFASRLQQHVVAAAAAMERRSSPSDAPQGHHFIRCCFWCKRRALWAIIWTWRCYYIRCFKPRLNYWRSAAL